MFLLKENGKAQVVFKDGQWIAEHIRTAILQFNYEVNKTNNMFIKDFEEKYIKEYEKLLNWILFFAFLTSLTTRLASSSTNLPNIEARKQS